MEGKRDDLCCACLCDDRILREINDLSIMDCFKHIVKEISIIPSDTLFMLCWECRAQLWKFKEFKQQVKESWRLYINKNVAIKRKPPRLAINHIYNIDIHTFVEENNFIKSEEDNVGHSDIDNDIFDTIDTNKINTTENTEIESQNEESDRKILTAKVKGTKVTKERKKRTKDNYMYKEVELTEKEVEEERRCQYLSEEYINAMFRCKKCIVTFPNEDDLKDHMNTHSFNIHTNTYVEDNNFIKSEEDSVGHSDIDNDIFDTIDTNKINTIENTEIESQNEESDRKILTAKVKGKKTKKKTKTRKKRTKDNYMYKEVELTEKEVEEERRCKYLSEEYINAMFRCKKCIVTFPNEDDLKDHIRIKHELNTKLKCAVCERTFASEISYNYHATTHVRRYECVACSHRFASKRAVSMHYNATHCCGTKITKIPKSEQNGNSKNSIETESYLCEYCDKCFKWKTSLRKHSETHKIERGQKRKPYCEPCRLSFTTTSNLNKHVRTSSKHQIQLKLRKEQDTNGDMSACIEQIKKSKQFYACDLCDKKFQWRGNLTRHLDTHASRAKGGLVCEPCNRTFSSIATYKQHMKTSKKHVSENEYKFMCSDCGKRFANKIKLRDHIEYEHLKVFRHICPFCLKVFKCHTSLYIHKQIAHKKNNPEHLCDQCGKAFPNGGKLRSHITSAHSSIAPHACVICAARFRWHSCLSRHIRRVHNNKK